MELAYGLRKPLHHRKAHHALHARCSLRHQDRHLRRGSQPGEVRDGSLFEHSNGFVSYGIAQIDKTAFVSLSTWETRAQADAATAKAADWVKANSRDRFALRENYVGDLAIDTSGREPASITH